jgi:hypothetical protein
VKQAELRDDLSSRIGAVTHRARPLVAVTPGQLAWSPPGGGWSVGQVLEHLVANNQSYFGPIEQHLAKVDRVAVSGEDATWKPTIVGNLLVRSLQSPRKLPAPKLWQPGPSPRSRIADVFLDSMAQLGQLIERGRDRRWQAVRLRSPASALIRLNLGDVFLALVVHAERHLGQIDRIRTAAGFPGSQP